MKVGIVTIIDYTNFGNRLQNYALFYVLKNKLRCKKVITLGTKNEKPFCNGDYFLWCKERMARLYSCMFPSLAEKRFGNNMTRWNNYCRWSNQIPTKIYYDTSRLPDRLSNEYDIFLAGSDQIWNYHFAADKFDDYFLKFAEDKKKASISASFGVGVIPDAWRKVYVDGLKDFRFLSVREEAGRAIIEKLLGKEVPVLVDPVMMLDKDEWLNVAKKPRVDCSKPYILKYYLGNGREEKEDRIDKWAKNEGYEVYELLNDTVPELYSAGPGEFISLIHNASMVCSDSFHGIVFSIIFEKPFIVYERRGKEDYMSSRLMTLLNKFGFEDRWENRVSTSDFLKCEYTGIKDMIIKEQIKFMNYLSEVLKDER